MAQVIHGEVRFPKTSYGQLSDFMSILVSNGYTVEIVPKETENIVIIMTEVE